MKKVVKIIIPIVIIALIIAGIVFSINKNKEVQKDYKEYKVSIGNFVNYVEADGKISAWEFKYNPTKTARLPLTFARAYPGSDFACITPDSYFSFLGIG